MDISYFSYIIAYIFTVFLRCIFEGQKDKSLTITGLRLEAMKYWNNPLICSQGGNEAAFIIPASD